MNPTLIPLIVAAILIPLATGGSPLRAWAETLALLAMAGGGIAAIHLLATLTQSYP